MKKENVRINKQWAINALEKNSRNLRLLSDRAVQPMVKDMLAGRWVEENMDPIVFDADGNLRNGQHRLAAIVQADVTLNLFVIYGASEQFIASLDRGRSRKSYEIVRLQNTRDKNRVCCALISYLLSSPPEGCAPGGTSVAKPTPVELEDFYAKHSAVLDEITSYAAPVAKTGLAKVQQLVAFFQFYQRDRKSAEVFVKDFYTPAGSVRNAQILRDWTLQMRGHSSAQNRRQTYGHTVHAALCFLSGRELKSLRCVTWNSRID